MIRPAGTEGTSSPSYTPHRSSSGQSAVPDPSRVDWLADYPPPRSLPLDQEALRLYEHAYAIGLKAEPASDPPVTYSTLLMALLNGGDETSQWFTHLASANGPVPALVYLEKKIAPDEVAALVPPIGRPEPVRLSADRHLLTLSARTVLGNAEQWAQRVGGTDIGVRHLVAAYVLNPPPAHYAQMQRWNYQETKWRVDFYSWVAGRYTAEQWTETQFRPAPTQKIAEFEQQGVKGAALAFPGDECTLQVLDRAAALHARASDRWLRLQTLFHALVESARGSEKVRSAVTPLWDAVALAGGRYEQARDASFTSPENDAYAPFEALDISPRVLNALETARELALATRHNGAEKLTVGALQLAGALLSRRVDADGDVAALGLDPQHLRPALIQHAQASGESAEVWREALGEEDNQHAGRPVDLSSDEPEAVVRLDLDWKSDPLAIRTDVETFAALLASKRLEPPLSIGLFGPWGSGKTTFLKRLRRAVDRRATEAKGSTDSPYVGNVVHVDFNAWHFAEEALTSSLVETILRELSAYIREDAQLAGNALLAQRLAALESTKRKLAAAEAAQNVATDGVRKAEDALTEASGNATRAAASMQAVVQRVWMATKSAFVNDTVVKRSRVLEAAGDAVGSVDELRDRLNTLRNRPARMLNDLGWPRSLLFAMLVLAVPPGVAWLVQSVVTKDLVVQLLSSLSATLSVVVVWARAASGAVAKVDAAIAKVVDEYAKQLAADPGVLRAKTELDAARAGAAAAAASVEAAREALARAKKEAMSATLPAQMLQLVSSRIDAQTYRKELTTMSLARADLQALSQLLRDQRGDTGAAPAGGNGAKRQVDRIILYIDDLDRCKPRDVVRVLQLVHMLLAFELFVVVVAVDARWVEESLRQTYSWLGDGASADEGAVGADAAADGAASRVTPQDYLEKIFQIAFWLEPMTAARAASYLGSLVPGATRESGPVYGLNAPADTATVQSVQIAGIELDYMRALAAYMGSSPRRVKRLVNAYRLIKASLGDAQLASFLTDRTEADGTLRSGPYQIVVGLLVIATGAPGSSSAILKELSECDPTESWSALVERFRERGHADWTMAARVLETVMRTQKARNVSELRGWARKVGRFLLHRPAAAGLVAGQPPEHVPSTEANVT